MERRGSDGKGKGGILEGNKGWRRKEVEHRYRQGMGTYSEHC